MKRVLMTVAAIGFVLVAQTPSSWSAEIGRATVGGKEIIVNDDNTWSYAAAAGTGNCTAIKSEVLPVSLCLDPVGWGLANLEGAAEQSFKRKDTEFYLMLITEKEFFDQPTLKKAVLTNAQNAAGLEKVKTLDDGTATVSGKPFGRIVYQTIIDGLDVTYENYYSGMDGKGSVQFVFFALTADYEKFRPFIDEAVAGLKVE